MFLSLDGTFWIQILNFFIFFAILNVVYIKPASEALRKRRAYIDGVHAEYEEARRTVRDLRTQGESKRAEARREAAQRAVAVRSEAQRKADEILSAGQAKGAEIVGQAQRAVEDELRSARSKEEALVSELAETMLARAMGGT